MMRWKKKLTAALLACGGLAGCKQQLYMTLDDNRAVSVPGLPKNLGDSPDVVAIPSAEGHGAPPTVDHPDRPARFLTLSEAFAISLESGTRGNTSIFISLNNAGRAGLSYLDDLGTFNSPSFGGDDAIRAFAIDPAAVGSNIEGALAKFDAQWLSTMQWSRVDTAVSNELGNFTNGDTAQFNSGVYKPLPSGGFAGITFNTSYTKLASPPQGFAVINPAYQPSLTFNFEQPLLRDYGVEINQLLPSHPISSQIQGLETSGARAEGILITRIRADQQRADFERSVNLMLFNVETIYWGLYANYFSLYAAEQGLRQAYLTWQLRVSELLAGKTTAHEVAQVRAQFAAFRTQRIVALQSVLESERELRGILGMKIEDGTRLVPADAPTLALYKPDWSSAISDALNNRPELIIAREDIKANQLAVLLQQNNTRPDLRAFASYGINSIGTTLDGAQPANALANLSNDKFNNWTLGVRMQVVLGSRDANASLRLAQLTLARSHVVLKNQELKAERFLEAAYQNLFSAYRQIEANREQRVALAEQLKGLYARFQAGKDSLITILTAQQQFASALSAEYTAIANYNIAIAAIQYAKGSLMQYDSISVADGALPNCILERATDHMRKRTEGIILRERATIPGNDGPEPLPRYLMHQPEVPTDAQINAELAPAPRTSTANALMTPDTNASASTATVAPNGPASTATVAPPVPQVQMPIGGAPTPLGALPAPGTLPVLPVNR
jgi:outer membrane protein TolC